MRQKIIGLVLLMAIGEYEYPFDKSQPITGPDPSEREMLEQVRQDRGIPSILDLLYLNVSIRSIRYE
jgi:hypothetical protein